MFVVTTAASVVAVLTRTTGSSHSAVFVFGNSHIAVSCLVSLSPAGNPGVEYRVVMSGGLIQEGVCLQIQ